MKITQTQFNGRTKPAKEQGAAVIEFALVLVILLMFVTGIIEFGRAFWYYDALNKATRDAARYLSNTRVSALVALDTATQDQAKQMVVDAATFAQVPSFTTADVDLVCEPNCDAPVYVIVGIDAYPITIGGWIPVLLPVGSTTWSSTLSPSTAMRYMR